VVKTLTIGDRIKSRRKHLGMSADELGKRLGKDRSTIYRYEKGDIENLPLDILEPIANALGTTPQYLMGWEQVQKKNDTLSDIVIRMQIDDKFFSVVEALYKSDDKKLSSILTLLE
jgi:transcriptional regulator with XRE-family HTH domain